MGVVAGLPAPIKIQLQNIQSTKFEYILDSSQYDNKHKFISKACTVLSANSTIQKVVLKLFFPEVSDKDLSKAISKLHVPPKVHS